MLTTGCAESNAIVFHKLLGEMVIEEIVINGKEGFYKAYPVTVPLKLRKVMETRDETLKRDEDAAKAKLPQRDEALAERKLYEDESLIKALVLKRPGAVIAHKKDKEGWTTGQVGGGP